MASKLGHIVTEETRKKISIALRNEKHFNWKQEVTYGIVHYWLRVNFGKPTKCEFCEQQKTCDWALIKGKVYERERKNFIPLCRKCHWRYDHPEKLRGEKPKCADCGIQLKDWYARRCYSHAQKQRFKNISHNSISP